MDPAGKREEANPLGLDSPWLRRQVEGHLVFGFFARRLALGWVFPSLALVSIATAFTESWWILLGRIASAGIILLLFRPAFRMSRYHQAAIGWWSVKIAIGLFSFVTLIAGFIGFVRGQPDAAYLTLLALLWVPGIEFVPSLQAHQRTITLGRILFSLPVVVLGSRVGGWTWH